MADLVTVQDYKDSEGLTGAKDDDRLNILVPQISELVKKYCGLLKIKDLFILKIYKIYLMNVIR